MSTPDFEIEYGPARERFLRAASEVGATVVSYDHPLVGRRGEALATDVARLGPSDAQRALVVTSGTHGVEGVCGSGIQSRLLEGVAPHIAEDLALVFVHAHNPHGFSWWRRTTEENVDLNRNGRDFSRPLPVNEAYAEVHPLLLPDDWEGPARRAADERIEAYKAERGEGAWQAAVSCGQHEHADGLFYGGREATWSHRTIRDYVGSQLADFEHVGVLDLHTGLGPRGHGELIYARDPGDDEHQRLLRWLGSDVTSVRDGSSTSAPVEGTIDAIFRDVLGDDRTTFCVVEYGTVPIDRVLGALRADNWLHAKGDPDGTDAKAVKALMREAFWGDDAEWQDAVTERALECVGGMIRGLHSRVTSG
ncbi:MAG: M14 family metallopeptidase [Planctomycetota bacterium]